jgi:hypothetical protein
MVLSYYSDEVAEIFAHYLRDNVKLLDAVVIVLSIIIYYNILASNVVSSCHGNVIHDSALNIPGRRIKASH